MNDSVRVTRIWKGLALAGLLALTACHANVTYRLDFNADRSVTSTIKEVVDDQFYSMASNNNADPMGADAAAQNGWHVERTTDDNDNHVIVMTKTTSAQDFAANGGDASALPSKFASAIPVASPTFERGLFIDTAKLDITIPPLVGKAPSSDNPYASAGASMAASIISFHFVLKAPGTVLNTNGETLPDGATSWPISFSSPTSIRYEVQTPDIEHIAIAAAAAVIVLLLVIVFVVRKRRTRLVVDAPDAA